MTELDAETRGRIETEEDIYAKYGPFGPAAAEQREAYTARMTPAELQKRMKRMRENEARVARQIREGSRPLPSSQLTGECSTVPASLRALIVDLAANHADRNGEVGRADQCVPFAAYVRAMLEDIGIPARIVIGKATYQMNGDRHVMHHAWIEADDFIIDGNSDSFQDNITIPNSIKAKPYWGAKGKVPHRVFKETRELTLEREVAEIHDEFAVARSALLEDFRRIRSQTGI